MPPFPARSGVALLISIGKEVESKMNEKEVAEIRRRFRPQQTNITKIRGCCVNGRREILSEFSPSLALMDEAETEKFLTILKKTLSGTLGKNLIDLSFATQQVVSGEEHKLLMKLRSSLLEDEEAVHAFYEKIVQSIEIEGTYLILLACDRYDVPYRGKDGESLEDASSEMFTYILCSICPIKLTKPALSYQVAENEFHNLREDWLVSAPEAGFLFPAFDGRCANLYGALYYTKSASQNHPELIDSIFRVEPPAPADEQRESFQSVLAESLEKDCSLDVVQAVHSKLSALIADHKANKEEEPLSISRETVRQVLSSCDVAEEHVAAFEQKYEETFGEGAEIRPQNIVNPKQLEVCTPDVTIRVNPERGDLIETRVLNGIKYILIRADEGVEVNGVNIHITPTEEETQA